MSAAAAAAHHPACRRCGSRKLRPAHSLSGAQRLARHLTPLDRYACGHCGHRGWSWGKVQVHEEHHPAAVPGPGAPPSGDGRPLESRDHRLRRRVRARNVMLVAASLVLGVAMALVLQRCGVPPGE